MFITNKVLGHSFECFYLFQKNFGLMGHILAILWKDLGGGGETSWFLPYFSPTQISLDLSQSEKIFL